ncbi:YciI family protein [Jiangella endophytica]|uniref:YciI family protein n=1 Tax=Jiangella endophytica TaxID=1623398 RepID=UPI000E352A79|nr:YciI family protein [Jiangella endophytica]
MTQYAILIFEREAEGGQTAELPPEIIAAHEALPGRIVEKGGKELGGIALEPSATATTIRGDLVTDGPFIETKEALAGVFVIEARDLDHAIELAALTPIVSGGVEVRPLVGLDFSGLTS